MFEGVESSLHFFLLFSPFIIYISALKQRRGSGTGTVKAMGVVEIGTGGEALGVLLFFVSFFLLRKTKEGTASPAP